MTLAALEGILFIDIQDITVTVLYIILLLTFASETMEVAVGVPVIIAAHWDSMT